jgi:hypothetical protein
LKNDVDGVRGLGARMCGDACAIALALANPPPLR